MIDKMNKAYVPTKEELIKFVEGEPGKILKELCEYIENEYKAKVQIDYSVCSGAPGWNFKLKKSSKSICTIYPEKENFIVLITLNAEGLELFNIVANDFSQDIRNVVDKSGSLNNTKWLMIKVKDKVVAEDIKKLLKLKFGK